MKSTRFTFLSLCVTILLASCNAPTNQTLETQHELGTVMPEESIDGHFARLGQQLSGFGGFFFDDAGQLNVVLTEKHPVEEIQAAIVNVFGKDSFERAPTERNKEQPSDPLANIKIIEGKYSVLELLTWRDQSIDILSLEQVISLDMDEARNRIVVSHTKEAKLETMQSFLKELGLPLEAFVFEVKNAVELFQGSVRDTFRPVPGGVQMNFNSFNACTIGFNAVRNGVTGFVTNAHCIPSPRTTFYQPFWPQGIASSAFTPAPFANGPCPRFSLCTFSDSGFVNYATRDSFGFPVSLPQSRSIARPLLWNGQTNLPFGSARFSIFAQRNFPFRGEELDKVGRTTGWTFGVVTGTCVHTGVLGSTETRLCQDFVTRSANQSFTIAGPGDSGSPVFFWDGGTGATLVGLLWGGATNGQNFVFSSLGNITLGRELGPITLR
jgi:hypothetical protein